MRQRKAGFTLIEILIVIFIISIVSTISLLTIGQNENKRIETFTKEFIQLLKVAQEQAILQPAIIGIFLKDQHFIFSQYIPPDELDPKNKTGKWLRLEDNIYAKFKLPNKIVVDLKIDQQKNDSSNKKVHPNIFISMNGDISSFRCYIGKKGDNPLFVIVSENDGNLIVKRLDE